MQRKKWFEGVLVVGVALALAIGVVALIQGGTEFQEMSASGYLFSLKDGEGTTKFSITDAGNATVAGTFTSNGAGDFDSSLNVDGATTLDALNVSGLTTLEGGFVQNSTTITVTDGQTITPTTYSGYRLNAAGEVTITLAVCSSDFQPLYLYGEDAQTINIADTNIRTNDGNAQVVGQYDVISWMCIDAEWVEISESNNS